MELVTRFVFVSTINLREHSSLLTVSPSALPSHSTHWASYSSQLPNCWFFQKLYCVSKPSMNLSHFISPLKGCSMSKLDSPIEQSQKSPYPLSPTGSFVVRELEYQRTDSALLQCCSHWPVAKYLIKLSVSQFPINATRRGSSNFS